MKSLMVLRNFFLIFLLSCSEQNFSSIKHSSHSQGPNGGSNENRAKIESTDIGNGAEEPRDAIESDRFDLSCQPSQDRYGCTLNINDFIDGEIRDISWTVSNQDGTCAANDLGYPNGTNLSISFTSSQECSEWVINVALILADEQTSTLTFDSKVKGSPENEGNTVEEQESTDGNESTPVSQETPDAEAGEAAVEMIPLASLLMDVEDGIAGGHFDVDVYSCIEEASGGKGKKGDGCLEEHVHEYDIEAERNGIDLLNPRESSDDIEISTSEDFCILALNTEYSQEAVIKLNHSIFKASKLPSMWDESCDKYNLEGNNGLPQVTALELSFPVNVIDIPNGIKQSSPNVAQNDPDRGGSLLIRFVNASTGEFIKEISVYHHE